MLNLTEWPATSIQLYIKLLVPVDDVRPQSITLGLMSGRHIPTKRALNGNVRYALQFVRPAVKTSHFSEDIFYPYQTLAATQKVGLAA